MVAVGGAGRVASVSVLFTDLVGSTALSASVSPEAADELRREHFGVLRKAIAEADGTEVKNLGDGLMVVLPSASAALACAVGMQQATEADNRGRDQPFGLRVGVSAGEAVEEDGDFFGDPVVEAARLCAQCGTGQVLATDLVRLMAGRRSPYRCEPIGELELKGLPDLVEAVEVVWEPLEAFGGTHRVPLPSRLAGRPRALVGRTDETAALEEAFKRTAAGDGREVVVVAGEAGLGKTTLVAESAREAFAAGACVLFGHAEEDLATPYGLFAEALGHMVTHAPLGDLRAYVEACGTDLARVVPALSRRLPDLAPPAGNDAEAERYQLFASVVGLFRHISTQRPVVLVVDDLQWADTASLQLLRHLLSEDSKLRLLVLATFRDTEVATGHPLVDTLAALWRMDRVARVDLTGLDDRAVLDLLETTAGHTLDDAGVNLAHALYRETDGNPFFVSEVLRHLVETGAIYQDATGHWTSDLSVDDVRLPDSVREVVGARVARLGPDAARVLSTAAVIGRDFDLELLARATEVDEDDVLDLLEAAEQAALVRDPSSVAGRFSFTHALIQRTLYQDLSATRRARTHERVAEALEDLLAGRPGERIGELAHHWAQATRPADTAKAVGYAVDAGDAALAALAPAEALRWYTQALELLGPDQDEDDSRQRAGILIGLGQAQLQTGDPAHRETLLDAARLADDAGDVELLVQAVLANNRGFSSIIGGVDDERIAAIDLALDRLPATPSADRARLLALAALERTYAATLPERLDLAEEAVTAARASGDRHALAHVMHLTYQPTFHPEALAIRHAWTEEGLAALDEDDDQLVRYYLHANSATLALQRADGGSLDAHAHAVQQIGARSPHSTIRWDAMFQGAWSVGLRGDLAEYERRAEAALNLGLEHGQDDAFSIYGTQLASIRFLQGRINELIPMVEQVLADSPALHAFRAVLILAKARNDDLDEARAMLEEDHRNGFQMPENPNWSTGMGSWVRATALTGARDVAPALRERLVPYHDQIVSSTITFSASIAHFLGLLDHVLGRHDDAEAWFAEAVQLHEQVRSPVLVAETQAAWSALLADRDRREDRDQARHLATAALDAAVAGGYGYVERDARAVLGQLA